MSERDDLLAKARRTLTEAKHLRKEDFLEGCVSRAYYAMFHAARAALLTENVTPTTHKGVRTMFGKYFVKTERLSPQLGRDLNNVLDARQSADYKNVQPAASDADDALQRAAVFVEEIEHYLHSE